MTRTIMLLAATSLLAACAPEIPPSWERGNCLASTPEATQLALLRARADSSPIFLLGSTDAARLRGELDRRARALEQDTIWVRSADTVLTQPPLSDAWWHVVQTVHPELEPMDSSLARAYVQGRFALDSTHTAFLLRVPGVEVAFREELWIHSAVGQCFLLPELLALAWGDGGETSELETWIVDLDANGVRELVQRSYSSITTENPDDTLAVTEISDSVAVLRWRVPRFVQDSSFDLNRIPWARIPRP
ncbi:MAG: hypothetical protein IPJ78_17245 [Gemmatimonadetes bacterium]|nr:hypothetical protein [Gemmatimonadota bacterium]